MEYRQCIGLRRAAVNELTGGAGRDYARGMKRVAIAGMGFMGKTHTMRALYVLDRATIEIDFRRDPVLAVYPVGEEPFAPPLPEGDGYFHELEDFVAGLEAGRLSGTVTVESAAEAVEVCHAEVRSAREGREVYL